MTECAHPSPAVGRSLTYGGLRLMPNIDPDKPPAFYECWMTPERVTWAPADRSGRYAQCVLCRRPTHIPPEPETRFYLVPPKPGIKPLWRPLQEVGP